ncbi:MAG: MATE family efflux transporter [Clostridium sp.]
MRGLPTAIFSTLMSVSTIVLNQILVAYGNAPVAAIGIVFKANMFITFLQMGLANGVQPLLGYNFGSGNRERFQGDCSLYQEVLCDHWCSGHAAVFCITQINHRTFHPG